MAENPEQTFERLGPGGVVGSTRFDDIGLNDIEDTFRAPLDPSVLMVTVDVIAAFPAELIAQQEYWAVTAAITIGGDWNLAGDTVTLGMSSGAHAHGDELDAAGLVANDLFQAMDAERVRLFLANETDPRFALDYQRLFEVFAIMDDFSPVVSDIGSYDILEIEARLVAAMGNSGSDFGPALSALVNQYLEVVRMWYDPIYWIEVGAEPRQEVALVDTWSSFNFTVDSTALGFGDIFVIGTTWVETLDLQPADFALPYTITASVGVTDPATSGNDTLNGGIGRDQIDGLAGNDRIDGRVLNDTLAGGDGNDTLIGGSGADSLAGGTGTRDLASYSTAAAGVRAVLLAPGSNSGDAAGDVYSGIEDLQGTAYNDTLGGDNGANRILGGAGSDGMDGLAGADTLLGEAGNDTLVGGAGADVIDGGAGAYDGASYWTSAALRADLIYIATNTGDAAGDSYSGIENLQGSGFNDTLGGDHASNTIGGLAGHDAIDGRGGNDTLGGEAGNDTLVGSDGNDLLVGGAGADRLDGGIGSLDAASYVGSASVRADLAFSSTNTGDAAGDTYFGIENLQGSNADDILGGNEAANMIGGLGGNDAINGRGGNDTIGGGDGNDSISGGVGNDLLVGNAGSDAFVFNSALGVANSDQVVDYVVADDAIWLENAVMTGLSAGALAASAFVSGAAATTADHRVIYNSVNGQLLYDSDGNSAGVAVLIATIGAGLSITAGEFLVI